MKTLQLLLPDGTHKDIKRRALEASMSMKDYILASLAFPIKVDQIDHAEDLDGVVHQDPPFVMVRPVSENVKPILAPKLTPDRPRELCKHNMIKGACGYASCK